MLLDEEDAKVSLGVPQMKARRVEAAESTSNTALLSGSGTCQFSVKGGDGIAKMNLLAYGAPRVNALKENRAERELRSASKSVPPKTPDPVPPFVSLGGQRETVDHSQDSFATPPRRTSDGSGSLPATVPKVVYGEEDPMLLGNSPLSASSALSDTPPAAAAVVASVHATTSSSVKNMVSPPPSSTTTMSPTNFANNSQNTNSSLPTTAPKKSAVTGGTKQMKLSDFFFGKK